MMFGLPGRGKSHFAFTSANISRWFFVARNRQGEVIVLQSHMDECYGRCPVVGPFFSVEEAKKMKERWA